MKNLWSSVSQRSRDWKSGQDVSPPEGGVPVTAGCLPSLTHSLSLGQPNSSSFISKHHLSRESLLDSASGGCPLVALGSLVASAQPYRGTRISHFDLVSEVPAGAGASQAPSDSMCSWRLVLGGRFPFMRLCLRTDRMRLHRSHWGHRHRTLRQTPRHLLTDTRTPGRKHVATQNTAGTKLPQSKPETRHTSGAWRAPLSSVLRCLHH